MMPEYDDDGLPLDDSARGRVLDARLHLLDRQVLDPNGEPVMTVDDIDLDMNDGSEAGTVRPGDQAPTVRELLTGPVLSTRIFGGRPPRSRLEGVKWADVQDVDVTITTARPAEAFDLTWRERWLRDRVVGRIPGGRHDPQ